MKPPRVLIVDDESNIRLMLRSTLESEQYQVDEAANGREAVDRVRLHPVDLMVLDLNMPVMDGMAVLQELAEWSPAKKPRVIVLTAYGSIPMAVKATRLGALDFLEKPITPEELRSAVAGALAEPLAAPRFDESQLDGGYTAVLDRVRKALRLADYTTAEWLLMKAADLNGLDTAPYFNLLGVLYEAQQKWRLARKCYGKAIAADGTYEPAQLNMRRLYELETLGRSTQAVTLGDELDMWFARMPVLKD
ncbi:MAG: response regulator [Tepidisphaerales bacterium]